MPPSRRESILTRAPLPENPNLTSIVHFLSAAFHRLITPHNLKYWEEGCESPSSIPIEHTLATSVVSGSRDISNYRIEEAEVPASITGVANYLEGEAYRITAKVKPMHETKGGKARDVSVLAVIFFKKTPGLKKPSQHFTVIKEADSSEAKAEMARVESERVKSGANAKKVLGDALRKPLPGGMSKDPRRR